MQDFTRKLAESTDLIEFATTPFRAYVIVANLQLALRHPENTGESAEQAREIAENLIAAITHFVPEAAESLEQGWAESYDVTRDYFEAEFD